MNILITGSNGQLGSEIKSLSSLFEEHRFFFTDVAELDITKEASIEDFIKENKIDALINCAAYTAVDKAEAEAEIARLINVEAVKNLSKVSTKYGVILIQISTDYVFDGKNHRPYVEDDKTNPQSVYAATKLEAEKMVEKFASKGIVVRTSWLYSSFGNNFVKTMMKYGKERDSLNVVFDQIGTPTYANNLAETLLKMCGQLQDFQGYETYHYSNEGVCSWYDFALAIMEENGIDCKINPILSEAYPLPAPRPFYSVLDKSKIKTKFAVEIPHWKDGLRKCLKKINQ